MKRAFENAYVAIAAKQASKRSHETQRVNGWYESALLWGAGGMAVTFVLAAVAAMIRDLRWLLPAAGLFAVIAVWDVARKVSPRHGRAPIAVSGMFIAAGLYLVNVLLTPRISFDFLSPAVLPSSMMLLTPIHHGPEPIGQVTVTIDDQDRLRVMSSQSMVTSEQMAASHKEISYSEQYAVDGTIVPSAPPIWWPLLYKDSAYFTLGIAAKTGNFAEDIRLQKINGQWAAAIKVSKDHLSTPLMFCRDTMFPAIGEYATADKACSVHEPGEIHLRRLLDKLPKFHSRAAR